MEIQIPEHFLPLFDPDDRKRFYALYGGRGGGKSVAASLGILTRVEHIESVEKRPVRVLCAREIQRSIEESVKFRIERWIEIMGKRGYYNIYKDRIDTPRGGRILFQGISNATHTQLRSLESIDIVWFEEAQFMSNLSRETLYPTIFRNPGAEIWFTFNPRYRTDAVYMDFVYPGRRIEDSVVMKGNFNDLPDAWQTPSQKEERESFLRDEPERFPHVWLGEIDDLGEELKILPFHLIQLCVDAYDQGKYEGFSGRIDAGLDIADSGVDFNAMVVRYGPIIFHAEKWQSVVIGDTARRADRIALEKNVARLFYDVTGVGAGVRSYFNEMARAYAVEPERFGSTVRGGDRLYTSRVRNRDFFSRRNAQLGWALRIRAQNTQKLMNGEEVDPSECLFIDSSIPRLDDYLAQLHQPTWKEGMSSRIDLIKRDPNEPSPDLYDATVLAFAQDSKYGLRLR